MSEKSSIRRLRTDSPEGAGIGTELGDHQTSGNSSLSEGDFEIITNRIEKSLQKT